MKVGGRLLGFGVTLGSSYLDYREFYTESHDKVASGVYAGIGLGAGLVGTGLAAAGAPILGAGAAVLMVTIYDQTEYKYVYAHRDDLANHPEKFAEQAGIDYMNTYYPGNDRYELVAEMIIPGGQVIPEEKVVVHELARTTGLTESVRNTGPGRALKSWGWI